MSPAAYQALCTAARQFNTSRRRMVSAPIQRLLLLPKREQCVGTEDVCQRHIGSVTAMRNENAPDPRGIVPRIEGMPPAAEIDFYPRGEIHRRIRRRKADIRDVAGAIPRRDVQAATESNRQMREVAAHPAALCLCLKRGSGDPRMLVAEVQMGCERRSQMACTA